MKSRWSWTRVVQIMMAGCLLALMALPQLAHAQDDKIQLLVWDQFVEPAESAAADAIYASFTEQNPNITIKREAIQTEQMRQTVRTALASGTGPDIIFYDAGPGWAGVLAEAGLLLPLDDMAAKYGWNERIAESALRGTTVDGHLIGLPLQVDLVGMYVNKTVLDENGLEIPTTLDELAALCTAAKEKGLDPPMAFADNPGWEAFHQFSMTANDMIGPEEMEKFLFEGQAKWDTPEMVQAISDFFVKLPAAGCFTSDVNAFSYDDGNSLFYSGQSPIHTTGSWLVGEIDANMPDFDVEFVPFPEPTGAKGRYWITGVGSAYMISANSAHQEEAGAFIDFLFQPEQVERWVSEAKYVVPAQFDTSTIDTSPLFKSILDVLQSSLKGETELGYNIDVMAPQPFNDMMQNGFQAIIAGQKTPEQQAADLEAAWNEK